MTELIDNGEEVGRRQGGETAMPSANLFQIKVKECHCDPDEARDREKQSIEIYTRLLTKAKGFRFSGRKPFFHSHHSNSPQKNA